MKPRKRHWYHVTSEDHGQRWVAARIAPKFRGPGEPDTPRLCVAATVARCLSAVLLRHGEAFVYQTANPRAAINPGGSVWDAPITGERWIVPPVEMVRVAVLPEIVVHLAQQNIRAYITRKRAVSPKARISGLMDAIEALRERDGDLVWFDRRDERVVAMARERGLLAWDFARRAAE